MNLMLRLIREAIDMKLMISWAVTSSVLILIVLAVRYLFRNQLSARLKYALWGVVLLRLLVPFQIELPAAAPVPVLASNLAQDMTSRLDNTMLYAIPTEDQLSNSVPEGLPPQYQRNGFPDYGWEYYTGGVVYDGNHITRYAFMMAALEVLIILWIAGTALAALVILTSNLRFDLRLRKRRKRLTDVDAPIPVYAAGSLPSPCLFGILRPAVYVTPEAAEHSDTLRHVLAHELTHYAHFDHLWSPLRCLALALHWYNPLVWLAVVLSKRDGELACDEGAVASLGEEERIPYGRTLVDMVAARSVGPVDLLSCSTAMTGGKKSIQQRVTQLAKKPETVKTALFAAVSVVVLAVVFVFAGRPLAEQSEEDLFKQFQAEVEQTVSIRYCPPLYSSTIYLTPIDDRDLLDQVKQRLAHLVPVPEGDPTPPPETLMEASRIVLTVDGREITYLLVDWTGYTYLMRGDVLHEYLALEEDQAMDFGPILRTETKQSLISYLKGLVAHQFSQTDPSYAVSYFNGNFYNTILSRARNIYRGEPGSDQERTLTNLNLMLHARALLPLEFLPQDSPVEWDGEGWTYTLTISFRGPTQERSEESERLYYVVPGKGDSSYLCSETEQGLFYLGTVSNQELEEVDQLFQDQEELDRHLLEALEDCHSIHFEDSADPDITGPAALEQAKTILTSGLLIDDLNHTGRNGDNENITIRSADGLRMSSFLITNHSIRDALHALARQQQPAR